jgi:hypothetical protein
MNIVRRGLVASWLVLSATWCLAVPLQASAAQAKTTGAASGAASGATSGAASGATSGATSGEGTSASSSAGATAEGKGAAASPSAPTPAPGAGVLKRVVVLGASASCGIHLQGSLADALDAAIAARHEPPLDATSVLFFMLAEDGRAALVKRAVEHQPSAVVGVDFLFWYGYGEMPEEQRLATLEQGLQILDGFPCPIVVSEFPDMSPAVGLMLQASQVPAPETLAALNLRLRAWAAERPRVVLVPLAETVAQMRAGQEIRIGDRTLPAGGEGRYLQPDKLHPTAEGLVVMACLVAEGLRARIEGLKAEDFIADPAAVLAAYTAATKDNPPRGLF